MNDDVWDGLRHDLVARLPRLLDKALSTYAYFANTPPPENVKEFAAFQSSCRAALAHVHLLLKLAEWARASDAGEFGSETHIDIDRLIQEAESAIERYPDEE
ncbi:MAG: hypothetical protein U1E42_00435 [Rhodospirillales bacterium]